MRMPASGVSGAGILRSVQEAGYSPSSASVVAAGSLGRGV